MAQAEGDGENPLLPPDLRQAATVQILQEARPAWLTGDEYKKAVSEPPIKVCASSSVATTATSDGVQEPRSTQATTSPKAMPRMRSRRSTSWLDRPAPRWQWEHRTGFRDYSEEESARIECHFWYGDWMMRMKSGTGKWAKPREIYFYDMIQYDPGSNIMRRINRVPEITRWDYAMRRLTGMCRGFLLGEEKWWAAKSKADFDAKRQGRRKSALQIQAELMEQLYDRKGRFYKITSSWTFMIVSMSAILLNAAWIGVDADMNPGSTILDTAPGFVAADNAFCLWFSLELFLRFGAFKRLRMCFKDGWFVFDCTLVLLMVFETWILQIVVLIYVDNDKITSGGLHNLTVLRVLRLLRLSRLSRLFKVFPQLMVLLKGVAQAMKSLVFTLLMLFVLLFMFGVILKNFADSDPRLQDQGLGSVGACMLRLLISGTFLDNLGDFMEALKEANVWYVFFMLVFIFLSNLTMLNMLIGILCEVVARVAETEKDNAAKAELEAQVLDILECYDVEDDRHLRKQEFEQLMKNPDMHMILESHDIDVGDLMKLKDVLFEEHYFQGPGDDMVGTTTITRFKEISFPDFLEKVFQLRGGNSSTVTDIVELRGYLTRRFARIEEKLQNLPSPEISPLRRSSARTSTCTSAAGGVPVTSQRTEDPELIVSKLAPVLRPHGETQLPGQIRTRSYSGANLTDSDDDPSFRDALLGHLRQLVRGQEELRAEVAGIRRGQERLMGEVDALREALASTSTLASAGTPQSPGLSSAPPSLHSGPPSPGSLA